MNARTVEVVVSSGGDGGVGCCSKDWGHRMRQGHLCSFSVLSAASSLRMTSVKGKNTSRRDSTIPYPHLPHKQQERKRKKKKRQ